MAAHRYWRILVNSVNGAVGVDLFEGQLLVSGVDQTGSGTATASSVYPTGDPWKAFDNNNTTPWSSDFSSPFPQWIAYDFGSGNDKDIDQISWMANYASDRFPLDWEVQYSDNGSSWTTRETFNTPTGWTLGTPRYFTLAPDAPPVQVTQTAVLVANHGGAHVKSSGTYVLVLTAESSPRQISELAILVLSLRQKRRVPTTLIMQALP